MNSNKIPIGFVMVDGNPLNPRIWSGTPNSTYNQLIKYFDVEIIEINTKLHIRLIQACSYLLSKIIGKTYSQFNITTAKSVSSSLEKKLVTEGSHLQALFVIGSNVIAYTNISIPIFYLSDAVFQQMVDYYWFNISRISLYAGNKIEKQALENASEVLLASDWAKDGAIRHYQTDEKKLHVITLGANHESREKQVRQMNNDTIHLLFVGIDTERKGLDIALDCLSILNNMDTNKKIILDVVGCKEKISQSGENVHIHGYLSDEELSRLYSESHLFILPTKAECAGIVFAEAASFGIPSITYDTGGIANYVIENETGYRLPITSTAKDFADTILSLINDDDKYKYMSEKSRKYYEKTLNWDAWGVKAKEIIEQRIRVFETKTN